MRIEKKIIPAVYIPAHVETTKIYEFNELSKELQEKLIDEKQNEITYDEGFWDDWCIDTRCIFENIIMDKVPGIENIDVSFSLNSCQGDGVSFTGEVVGDGNITALLSLVYAGKIPHKVKRVIPYIYSIQFNRNHYIRYCHEYSVDTSVIDNYNDYTHDRFLAVLHSMEKAIDSYRASICKQLEKAGYDRQEYYTGREYAMEQLMENEYFESGEVA